MNSADMAQKEYEEVLEWTLAEEEAVVKRLRESGQYLGGLDTHSEEFSYIYEERNRRIEAIKKKYNI